MIDTTKSIEACANYYGQDSEEMKNYLLEGEKRALELPNRGPIDIDSNGLLSGVIREAYSKYGFYIFENCLLYTSPSPRDKRQSRMPSSA